MREEKQGEPIASESPHHIGGIEDTLLKAGVCVEVIGSNVKFSHSLL